METTTSRRFLFVPARVRDEYRREWRAIDRRFPHFSEPPEGQSLIEHWQTLAMLRDVAREELRGAIVDAAREAAEQGLESLFPVAI